MMNDVTYSLQGVGGIGYRADFAKGRSYTTNPDGSGLFWHNGRGDRQQVRGNGQFQAKSLDGFRRKVQAILRGDA